MGSEFRNKADLLLLCFLITLFFLSELCSAADRIARGDSIKDGDTMVSAGEKFALGFFSPDQDSGMRYVGIWYYKVTKETVIWVANRERPISGKDGVLTIGDDGNLIISNGNGDMIWSSNIETVASSNSTAVIMDTGNLVLEQNNASNQVVLWQSFDHPTDTYLPQMRLYMNVNGGEKRLFSSWKSSSDPAPGNYSMGVDPRGSPQIVIWEGAERKWRSGHWNRIIFTGIPEMRAAVFFGFQLSIEGGGNMYFTYTQSNSADLIKFALNWEGIEITEKWDQGLQEWSLLQSHPGTDCDSYNRCGAYGICDAPNGVQRCTCVEAFEPSDKDQWNRGNWSGGCIRSTKLQCEENINTTSSEGAKSDSFVLAKNAKLPDFVDYVGSEDSTGCKNKCLENCSCTAYAFVSGINCMIWYRDLVDVELFAADGNDLFVRVAHLESGGENQITKIVVIPIAVGIVILSVLIWLLWRYKNRSRDTFPSSNDGRPKISRSGEFSTDLSGPCDLGVEGPQGNGAELAIYSFNDVATATDNFSDENKLGEGGFGHVYYGTLPEGQKIAVKRLSRKSGQGIEEFKNEITVIAKLQHRNLVRLLGCCIEREEKMLIYEYMPNKSLDLYIFDAARRARLDWNQRFTIIEGIARGLLYLHRDSRLRIIHRDLKASNILLDEEMNPKISDFGMARIFGGNQNEENTNRVVGTYGYMAPEYAMEGLFSLKSDVYSFGILLLEIVTGRRNNSFRPSEYPSIIGNAWQLWDRGVTIELLDPSIASNSYPQEQVLRCIHVGMLCVQDNAAQRPNMSAVVLTLESENPVLPMPKQPTFTSMSRHTVHSDDLDEDAEVESSNNVTISVIVGR
ncbi:G-type lectin S-receptor-like serine/threonine-protein kinase B120 [Primulina tabacum]|uniref:G-type lectin S-receptor-like serine/threonine-protein kinase B120 n=1 Tax=Primulina tabacum TaxID=48773 RepID=UPI003F596B9E